MSAQRADGYDEKSRGPEYRRGFADGRLAERAHAGPLAAARELRRLATQGWARPCDLLARAQELEGQ